MPETSSIHKAPNDFESGRRPLVSIIIPYYQQSGYIADTVRSALNQTYQPVEVIVVDDGSPVPAAPSLDGIANVRLIRTENHGCPATRNHGFEASSGQYLIFLDGDDLLRPDAIEKHLAALQGHVPAVLSFGAVATMDGEGRETNPPRVARPRKDYFRMLLESNPIWSPGATMMRRDAFAGAGRFNDRLRAQVDDYDLYLRLARLGPFVQHNGRVLDYRLHDSNVSRDQEKMLHGTLSVLDQLAADPALTAADRRRLERGRRRWIHVFRPTKSWWYHLRSLYFTARSLPNVAFGRAR